MPLIFTVQKIYKTNKSGKYEPSHCLLAGGIRTSCVQPVHGRKPLDSFNHTLHYLPMELNHDACYRAIELRDPRFDGQFFTGVRTTGVYCRPICPAQTPKPENVVFYPSAAAAQKAGFRPCLRCRPETAPGQGAWCGTSSIVSRAVNLIHSGALDETDLAGFSSRLGVGERQLRRLFQQHLGASPIAIAQTRRVLLAKQLIHETQLPMTEIAFASGFNSIRRFNETFYAMYGCPPSDLRRGMKPERTAEHQGGISIFLAYRPPYDWPAMLAFLRKRAIAGMEEIDGDRYRRSICLNGKQGTVTVAPATENTLRVTVRFPDISALPHIISRIRWVFDLEADPVAIGAHLAQDAILAPLITARPGLRVPGAWDGFELAMRAVLGQQVTVTAAVNLAGRMVAAYGMPLQEPEGTLTYVFPEAETLANANLALLGMPAIRAATLSAIARSVVEHTHFFDLYGELEDSIQRLTAIPGIGEWTAHYIAMRQLRLPDAFPASDSGLLRAISQLEGRKYSPKELLIRSTAWRPWRAYAAQHLWASL